MGIDSAGGTATEVPEDTVTGTDVHEDTVTGTDVHEDTVTGTDVHEDTVDTGARRDAARILLSRCAAGDEAARTALVDVLGPRIHGLALHLTDSARRAERLTIEVLRSCIADASALATGALSGEAAVLDRARRMITPLAETGTIRSLVARADEQRDRTRDRRELDLVRVLLGLGPQQRAQFEAAAQGRFTATAGDREGSAAQLADVLDQIIPFGPPADAGVRALVALDALALAEGPERVRLQELSADRATAAARVRAIEAAARLTILTSTEPGRDLRAAMLVSPSAIPNATRAPAAGAPRSPLAPGQGASSASAAVAPASAAAPAPAADRPVASATAVPTSAPAAVSGPEPGPGRAVPVHPDVSGPARSAPSAHARSAPSGPAHSAPSAPAAGTARSPETPAPAYRGTYETPVLGSDTHRRMVGPPALIGGPAATAEPAPVPAEPPPPAASARGAEDPQDRSPAFAFRRADELERGRRERQRRRGPSRTGRSRSSWFTRALVVLLSLALAGMGWLWYEQREEAREASALSSAWARAAAAEGARNVAGMSDNGTWTAVVSGEGYALLGEGVEPYSGEVLQLWGRRDGEHVDLGVLDISADGTIRASGVEGVQALTVTREHRPRNQSGTPSQRVVATLDTVR